MITLKRFSYDFQTMMKSKILNNVDYPVSFRLPVVPLEKVGSTESRLISSDWSDSKLDSDQFPTYGLYAVIVHSGASADVGHYYCYARSSDATHINDEESPDAPWMLFNDHDVSVSSFKDLKAVTARHPKDSAYILFYRRMVQVEDNADGRSKYLRSRFVGPAISAKLVAPIAAENRRLYVSTQDYFSPLFRSLHLRRLRPELQIKPHYSANCTSTLLLNLGLVQEAGSNQISCDFCGIEIPISEKESHQKSCTYQDVSPWFCIKCGLTMPSKMRLSHPYVCVHNK